MTAELTPPGPARRVLIVSPSFPPSNAPDMQRIRMSLPYYREFGWASEVLAVDPETNGNAREDALLATLPSDVPVHRCSAWSPAAARRFGVGNLGWRSLVPLYRSGLQLLRSRRFDAVLISTSQFPVFLLGRLWGARLRVPYVIDLQDPWRRDEPTYGSGFKSWVASLSARLFEGWSFRRAAALMSVSPGYIEALRRRYPWFDSIACEVIGFGGSEHDLSAARSLAAPKTDGPQAIRIVYTGVAVLSDAAELLFRALKRFRAEHPEALKLRFEFIGTSYAAPGHGKPSFQPLAKAHGVDDLIVEQTDRIGHLDAIREQLSADALLLLGSKDPTYSPSKIYPYYLSGKPILAIVQPDSVAATLLTELACAHVVPWATKGSMEAPEDRVIAFFRSALKGFPNGDRPPRNDALFRQEYLARSLTQRQCQLFERALACHHR